MFLIYLCFYCAATDVISQEMEMQTEIGLKATEILLKGEAIPEEMAAKMVEAKINSEEVAHHGESFYHRGYYYRVWYHRQYKLRIEHYYLIMLTVSHNA